MTEELFREDATLLECSAIVVAVDARGVLLDRTVFYPQGGGQAGDSGALLLGDGHSVPISDTRKGVAAVAWRRASCTCWPTPTTQRGCQLARW